MPLTIANGNVYSCSMLDISMGNIYSSTLEEILNSDTRKLLQSLKWQYTENCNQAKCKYFKFCVLCYAANLSEAGSIFKKPEYFCNKARYSKDINDKDRV